MDSEIKTKVIDLVDVATGDKYAIIAEQHTIADICRWIVGNDWVEEFIYLLENKEKEL